MQAEKLLSLKGKQGDLSHKGGKAQACEGQAVLLALPLGTQLFVAGDHQGGNLTC